MIKICDECGKEFEAKSSRNRFCRGPHYQTCVICGKVFEYTCSPNDKPLTCSKACRQELTKRNNMKKYGVECVSQIPEVRDKKRESGRLAIERYKKTCRELYGVDYAVQRPEVRKKLSDTQKSAAVRRKVEATFQKHYGTYHVFANKEFREQHGCNEVFKNPEVVEKARQTIQERYGVDSASQIPEAKERAKESRRRTMQERYNCDCVFQSEEFKKNMKERFGFENPGMSKEVRSRVGKAKGTFVTKDGTQTESSYKQIVYDFCLDVGLPFEYQSTILEYEYEGKHRQTLIDFKIDGMLIECKGGHLMTGVMDCTSDIPMSAKLDVYKKHNVIVVTDDLGSRVFGKSDSTESNGLKYLHKCPEPLIGVDIELFKDFPSFPYREDRPKCFYNVKVDGQKSSHEAFYDKKIRWDMIKNRILYSGGFIDNKSILKALNVTRTCKQPSWFPKSRAKHIIKDYCTSMTIYDLAAGWGARYDAAMECKRFYVGCDFNKELVDWHHSQGRESIQFHDGRTFYYSKPCSVFICPPYSDPKTGRCFEDYNFEAFDERAKNLTQCDWLLYAIRNAPNASEYIMVCKVVDEGWEKFIVEDIENKSHFGSNHEYILKLSNSEGKEMLQSLQHHIDE